jgi:DNA-binding response OmpR family regulator
MSRQPLVLLVPPDRLTGMMMSNHLASYGLEIITASSVDQARDLLCTNRRISVLVLNTYLDQVDDSLSLAKSARASDSDLKVIYTSRMPFRLRETEKVSGAPCVRTPYRPHQLVGVISQLVRRHPTEEVEAYAA